jgi:hypothetical protein
MLSIIATSIMTKGVGRLYAIMPFVKSNEISRTDEIDQKKVPIFKHRICIVVREILHQREALPLQISQD